MLLKRAAAVSAVALAVSVTALVGAPAAFADSVCVNLPGSTTGFTIGAAGEEVRVPAISNVTVCEWLDGSYGYVLPDVRSRTNCGTPCFDVVVVNWNIKRSFGVTYRADGVYREVRVDLPPVTSGPPGETCVFGVGAPANRTCFTYLSIG